MSKRRVALVGLLLAGGALIASCGQSAFAVHGSPVAVSMQQADAGALTALQQAGCRVQSHEFKSEAQSKVTATSPSGASAEITYEPAPQGGVLLQVRTSGASEQECSAFAGQLLAAVADAAKVAAAK